LAAFIFSTRNSSPLRRCAWPASAILTGWWLTKGTPLHAIRQSRRLVDTIGWAVILPQMLAMLGGVFVAANTGDSVQRW
jgi:uncharacterized membrane protein